MSDLSKLSRPDGANQSKKRLGRGPGSGFGKTSGKGHKGQKARTGGKVHSWFEGGQMPLQRRVPKFGFKNNNKLYYKAVNLDDLEGLAAKTKAGAITFQFLVENGVISKNDKVKVLGRGELKKKVSVEAHAFSATAAKAIENVGGTATTVK